ncbi:PDR/VanB family oxidoreductase [Novosphingobium lentum]|uniref:PDR/VanB family oxidoreductase n=1 Tax=Novosphingobium lentum TaxID=145287 RepID=UPI00082EAF93|nr:PDR/VanB family oxidoreductase [Novosphingobium lentum]
MTAFTARIAEIRTEASGVKSFVLQRDSGADFPEWQPGAHIDVVLAPGLSRQYSLCGDPADRQMLNFAVLREPASRGGSERLHDAVAPGDTLTIEAIRNNFPLVAAEETLLIAGGIGITPLLTMAEALDRQGKRWRMLYGGRTGGSMAYLERLARHGENVAVRPEDAHGLLDLAGFIGAYRPGKVVYCCGPEPLIKAVEAWCASWPEDALQIERFRPKEQAPGIIDSAFEVELKRKGIVVAVPADQTIADALEAVGVHIPRSCNEGTCGTCVTKLLDGEPDHRDSFLRPKQRAEGKRIMVCCSRALSPRLVLDV